MVLLQSQLEAVLDAPRWLHRLYSPQRTAARLSLGWRNGPDLADGGLSPGHFRPELRQRRRHVEGVGEQGSGVAGVASSSDFHRGSCELLHHPHRVVRTPDAHRFHISRHRDRVVVACHRNGVVVGLDGDTAVGKNEVNEGEIIADVEEGGMRLFEVKRKGNRIELEDVAHFFIIEPHHHDDYC